MQVRPCRPTSISDLPDFLTSFYFIPYIDVDSTCVHMTVDRIYSVCMINYNPVAEPSSGSSLDDRTIFSGNDRGSDWRRNINSVVIAAPPRAIFTRYLSRSR